MRVPGLVGVPWLGFFGGYRGSGCDSAARRGFRLAWEMAGRGSSSDGWSTLQCGAGQGGVVAVATAVFHVEHCRGLGVSAGLSDPAQTLTGRG